VGGLGSTTGAVLAAAGFTLAGEWLRVVEEPATLFGVAIPGIPGMRMVILSLALLLVIIFCRRGLLGRREFSWAGLSRLLRGEVAGPAPGAGAP
jgi:branched-chain amino acid transport system permease protein